MLPNDEPPKLSLLARIVVGSILALIVAGIVWHGVSIPIFKRIWHDLVARPDAPMRFRFILQPLMVAIVAIRVPLAGPLSSSAKTQSARARRRLEYWEPMSVFGHKTDYSRITKTIGLRHCSVRKNHLGDRTKFGRRFTGLMSSLATSII